MSQTRWWTISTGGSPGSRQGGRGTKLPEEKRELVHLHFKWIRSWDHDGLSAANCFPRRVGCRELVGGRKGEAWKHFAIVPHGIEVFRLRWNGEQICTSITQYADRRTRWRSCGWVRPTISSSFMFCVRLLLQQSSKAPLNHLIVDYVTHVSCVGWELGGLIIHDIDIFANTVLPKYYNTRECNVHIVWSIYYWVIWGAYLIVLLCLMIGNFKTFRRQLNYYGEYYWVRYFGTKQLEDISLTQMAKPFPIHIPQDSFTSKTWKLLARQRRHIGWTKNLPKMEMAPSRVF